MGSWAEKRPRSGNESPHPRQGNAIARCQLNEKTILTYQFGLNSGMLLLSLGEIGLEGLLVGLSRLHLVLRGRSGFGVSGHVKRWREAIIRQHSTKRARLTEINREKKAPTSGKKGEREEEEGVEEGKMERERWRRRKSLLFFLVWPLLDQKAALTVWRF